MRNNELDIKYMSEESFDRIVSILKENQEDTLSCKYFESSDPFTYKQWETFSKFLSQNTCIKHIEFAPNQLPMHAIYDLATILKSNKYIESLNLASNDIDDDGAQALAGALKENNTIQTLDLRKNKITDAGTKALANALSKNSTLTQLFLEKNPISDQGATAFYEAILQNQDSNMSFLEIQNKDTEYQKKINAIIEERNHVNDILHHIAKKFTSNSYPLAVEDAELLIKHGLKDKLLNLITDKLISHGFEFKTFEDFVKPLQENITKYKGLINVLQQENPAIDYVPLFPVFDEITNFIISRLDTDTLCIFNMEETLNTVLKSQKNPTEKLMDVLRNNPAFLNGKLQKEELDILTNQAILPAHLKEIVKQLEISDEEIILNDIPLVASDNNNTDVLGGHGKEEIDH